MMIKTDVASRAGQSLFAFVAIAWIALLGPAMAEQRCVPLDFPSYERLRNVTEPGDVRIRPNDRVVLINKRKPERTRVHIGASAGRPVTVRDCAGSASKFDVEIIGPIEGNLAGKHTINSSRGYATFLPSGEGWTVQ